MIAAPDLQRSSSRNATGKSSTPSLSTARAIAWASIRWDLPISRSPGEMGRSAAAHPDHPFARRVSARSSRRRPAGNPRAPTPLRGQTPRRVSAARCPYSSRDLRLSSTRPVPLSTARAHGCAVGVRTDHDHTYVPSSVTSDEAEPRQTKPRSGRRHAPIKSRRGSSSGDGDTTEKATPAAVARPVGSRL